MTTVEQDALCVAQAPIALAAVAAHCVEHKLIAPHTIEVPALGDSEMRLRLSELSVPSWLATVQVDSREEETVDLGASRSYQRVRAIAALPVGIRVTLCFIYSPAMVGVAS